MTPNRDDVRACVQIVVAIRREAGAALDPEKVARDAIDLWVTWLLRGPRPDPTVTLTMEDPQ